MDKETATTYEIAKEFPPEPSAPLHEVADIFREYGPAYRTHHNLRAEQLKAMTAIEQCRTAALGAHEDECDHCGHREISYNSCRNRNCPKCRGSQRSAWVEAREEELLPIQYFHIVFTLPQAILKLSRYNATIIHNLLFRMAAATLQTFAQNRWDGKLGIIMVLHTWGQTISDHPHVHCIVTGGVLKNDGSQFVQAPKNFLFHIEALSQVFRGKFIEAMEKAKGKGELDLKEAGLDNEENWETLRAELYRHEWVVYAKRPFDQAGHLLRYLGRYVNRIAITNHRILSIDSGVIRFRYHDNRSDCDGIMGLPAEEFIRRFLSHIPPKGFSRVRYYGFLVNSQRKEKLILCRKLLGLSDPEKPYIPDMDEYLSKQGIDYDLYPACEMGTMRIVFCNTSNHDPPVCSQEAA